MRNNGKGLDFNISDLLKQNRILYPVFWLATCVAFYRSGIYIALVFTLLIVPLLLKFKYYDATFVLISLYSISMGLVGGIMNSIPGGGTDIIFIIISPPLFYLFGKYIVDKSNRKHDIILFLAITILCFGFFLYRTILTDIIYNGFINPIREMSIGGADRPATHYGTIASLGFIGLGYFIIIKKSNNLFMALIFLLCSILSIITTFHLINRAGILIFIISTISILVYYYKENISKLVYILFALILILLIVFSQSHYTLDLINVYEARNSYDAATLGSRTILWKDAIGNLVSYPWGWSELNIEMKHSLVHNYWLDNARIAGVFPFIFSVAILFRPLRYLTRMLKTAKDSLVSLFLGIFIVMFLSLFIEPQLDACPYYVSLFYLLLGLINKSYNKYLR